MVRARFVGSAPAEIMDTPYKFTEYGQSVGMPDEVFAAARAGRIHLLTEEQFQSLGHPEEEVLAWRKFENHVRAPKEFHERLREAWRICQEDPMHGEVTNA